VLDLPLHEVLTSFRDSSEFDYSSSSYRTCDLRSRVVASVYAVLNELFGSTARGRRAQVFSQSKVQNEVPHKDAFDGVTIHVQQRVPNNGIREVTMALRKVPRKEDERIVFPTVQVVDNKMEIWRGNIREGDVTVLNSGLTLPDGSHLHSVHQFRTSGASTSGSVVSFVQFIEIPES
jgi:hypothetical protein